MSESRRNIASITGLKAICALMVFWWHGPLPISPVDLGGRACEFFFLAAGFLCFYTQSNKPVNCSFSHTFEFMRKKLVSFYPLHLIGFILALFRPINQVFKLPNVISAVLNLSLLQAWSPSETVYFGFNGVSWFLSSFMFCCFLSGVVLRLLKNPRRTLPLFLLFTLLRFAIEYAATLCPEYFMINLHTFPVVRALEFFCGMTIASFTKGAEKRIDFSRKTTFTFSLLEIVSMLLCLYLIVEQRAVLNRAHYVLAMSLLLLIFSFDRGILSRILSLAPFRWLGGIQLEFYMLHGIIINLIFPHLTYCFWNWYVESTLLCLSVTLAAVWVYRRLLRKPLERIFDMLSRRIMNALRAEYTPNA